jgi:hypothetical protein
LFICLDLTNNSLTIVPTLTGLSETLLNLVLRRNQLCTIDSNVLRIYSALQTLEIDQNPLHCDCHLNSLSSSVNRTQIKITGLCQSPMSRRNTNVIDVLDAYLSCHADTLPQCTYLVKTEHEESSSSSTTTTTMTTTYNPTTTTIIKGYVRFE